MNARASLPPGYFEALYAADPDPWRFATSDYERGKYTATLAALPRPRYAHAVEVGCSIGVLTAQLATRCDHLTAIDAAAAPLHEARRRCTALPHVEFHHMAVPGAWPPGDFDLILLSEVVYYLDLPDLRRLAGRVEASLRPGGDLLLVHWTGETDYPLPGDAAAEAFLAACPFAPVLCQSRAEGYRLDLLRHRGNNGTVLA